MPLTGVAGLTLTVQPLRKTTSPPCFGCVPSPDCRSIQSGSSNRRRPVTTHVCLLRRVHVVLPPRIAVVFGPPTNRRSLLTAVLLFGAGRHVHTPLRAHTRTVTCGRTRCDVREPVVARNQEFPEVPEPQVSWQTQENLDPDLLGFLPPVPGGPAPSWPFIFKISDNSFIC